MNVIPVQFSKPWVLEESAGVNGVGYIWIKVEHGWRITYNKTAKRPWTKLKSTGAPAYNSPKALVPTNRFTQIETKEELFLLLL